MPLPAPQISRLNAAILPQLQMFLAVARLRSFTGAARELGVSTSAVSQAIRQLEEQLRVVLLTRTTRSVSPTDAGRELLERAGPALSQAVAALDGVSARPGEIVGRLRITVPQIAVSFVIAPLLSTFRARHPRVDVEIVAEDRFVDIVAEGYDAGVRLTEAIERDMVQVRLDNDHAGAFGERRRLGSPPFPTEDQLVKLRAADQIQDLGPTRGVLPDDRGTIRSSFDILVPALSLLEISPESSTRIRD